MIKIIISDDHTIVRQGLRKLMEAEPDIEVIGEAEDGNRAVDLANELNPDVVIMDLAMPLLNGLEATKIINKENPKIRILILSMYSDEEYVLETLEAGASGFLIKQTAASNLIEAVREVHAGRAYFSPVVSKTILEAYRKIAQKNKEQKEENPLSPREREVLQLIGEGHNNNEIAKHLFLSVMTIKKHRENIMRKLDIHDADSLKNYYREKGLIPGRDSV